MEKNLSLICPGKSFWGWVFWDVAFRKTFAGQKFARHATGRDRAGQAQILTNFSPFQTFLYAFL